MFSKRNFVNILRVLLIMFLICPLIAQKSVYKFKGVNIPFKLKHKDTVFDKGKYDFEILKFPTQVIFYLKIKKGRKNLCLIPGERLTRLEFEMNEIPAKPQLVIKKNPEEKMVYITFESGTLTVIFPCIRIRWKMEYE